MIELYVDNVDLTIQKIKTYLNISIQTLKCVLNCTLCMSKVTSHEPDYLFVHTFFIKSDFCQNVLNSKTAMF